MQIALITDSHFGVRNDNPVFLDNNKKFVDEVFLPTLEEQHVDTVVHLGDLLDRRKYINYNTASRLRKEFIEPMIDMKLNFHWILGNHDIYWRNNTDITPATELPSYGHYYDTATEIYFGDTKILFVPWICDSNRVQTYDLINKTDAKIVFGHLELEGFEMFKGIVQHQGINRELFKNFDKVYSGHYHHKSSDGRIFYLGATGEYTWSDYNDPRGFHLFDTDSGLLTFYRNPFTLFHKEHYNDTVDALETDFTQLTNKFVKVIVKARTNSDVYNTFLSRCEAANPLELIVVEDHLNLDLINDENIVSETKDTLTIIREFISQTNNMVDSNALDNLVVDLYKEAIQID